MAAGVTDKVWSVEDLAALIEDAKLNPPATYKKRAKTD